MNYSLFRFRATVDWVELEIETIKPIQGWRIKKCSGFSRVSACDPSTREPYPPNRANTPTTVFRAKDQDPKTWKLVADRIDVIEKFYPLAQAPKVIGIEVALDAYSRGATRQQMIELTAHLYKFVTDPVSDNHRSYHDYKGSVEDITCLRSLIQGLSEGRQIAIGNTWDDRYMHLYYKTTDSVRGGVAIKLPADQHRARIEITLRGEAIPSLAFNEWENFDFRSLTPYFNFRMLKPELNKFASCAVEAQAKVTGRLTKEQQANYRTRREFGGATLADKKLNDRSKGALRGLSYRW